MNISAKILVFFLLLFFGNLKAETMRIPINSSSDRTLAFDTYISKDEKGSQISSVSSNFSSTRGHKANAAIDLAKSDGTISYLHKLSNGAVTVGTNIIHAGSAPYMSSIVSGYSSINGHRANAAINLLKNDGIINYTHKYTDVTLTIHFNISSDQTMLQMNSIGGGFSGINGHGISATVNTTGGGGAINYILANHKFKFSGGVNVKNDVKVISIGIQLPLGR